MKLKALMAIALVHALLLVAYAYSLRNYGDYAVQLTSAAEAASLLLAIAYFFWLMPKSDELTPTLALCSVAGGGAAFYATLLSFYLVA